MAVYVDGSALSRFFLDVPHAAEWREWAGDRVLELRRSELGVVELRRVTAHLDHSARVVADALIELIREVRFSDQALARAATVEGRLAPFAALHFGVAVAEPDVDAIATYDALLAATCTCTACGSSRRVGPSCGGRPSPGRWPRPRKLTLPARPR